MKADAPHIPKFGWHFDAAKEHGTRQELIEANAISEATTHEDLFWIRHRVGLAILQSMRMRQIDRQQLIRSRSFWLWLRRLWLKWDRLFIEESLEFLASKEQNPLAQAHWQRLLSRMGDVEYEGMARQWFLGRRFQPNRALLEVVRDQNTDKPAGTDALLDA